METRISLLTLGVRDLPKSLVFYRDGLGWPTKWTPDRGVIFFQLHGTCLSLYPLKDLAVDALQTAPVETPAFRGMSIAHNTRSEAEVDEVLSRAEKAGGRIVKSGRKAEWGGYSGYFSDPDGHLWEVAYGAFPFNEDGSLKISDPT